MADIEIIIDSLERKAHRVLEQLEQLKLENERLTKALEISKQDALACKKQNVIWEEKYNAINITNAILNGSNENKKEAKIKINTLIKDIDFCISRLVD